MKSLGKLPTPPQSDTPIRAIAAAMETDQTPSFPSLSLDSEQAEAAGITNGETVGDTVTLKIKCKVTKVGDYNHPKDGETPAITLDITHAEMDEDSDPDQDGDNDENDDTNPDKDDDDSEDTEDKQEIPNTRPKPRVLSPKEAGFGDLND